MFLLLAISLSYPDSYIADKNIQATKPNSAIYRISLAVLFYNCYDLKLKGLSNKTTLVLSNTRELDRVPSTE